MEENQSIRGRKINPMTREEMQEVVTAELGSGYLVVEDELSEDGTWIIVSPVREKRDIEHLKGTPGYDAYHDDPDEFWGTIERIYRWEESWAKVPFSQLVADYTVDARNVVHRRFNDIMGHKDGSGFGKDFAILAVSELLLLSYAEKYSLLSEAEISEGRSKVYRVFGTDWVPKDGDRAYVMYQGTGTIEEYDPEDDSVWIRLDSGAADWYARESVTISKKKEV